VRVGQDSGGELNSERSLSVIDFSPIDSLCLALLFLAITSHLYVTILTDISRKLVLD